MCSPYQRFGGFASCRWIKICLFRIWRLVIGLVSLLFFILVSEAHYFFIVIALGVCYSKTTGQYGRPLVVTHIIIKPFMWEIHLGRIVEACCTNTGAERVQIRFTITDASGAVTVAVLSWLSFDVFVNVASSIRFTLQRILLRTLVVGWTSCPLTFWHRSFTFKF
jgi:hypothetical protein